MHTRKILSIITSSAILLGTLSSCSMFDYLEKSNVSSALLKYLTAVQEADYNESSELVVDEEDAFLLNEMSDTEAELIAAIQDASEYEIGEIEVNGSSASATVEFTLPDISSIADEGYSYDEFVAAIADIEDTVDETIEFELVKEDDKWLIEGDSTEDYYNFLIEFISDLEFTRLTEDNAIELVDTFMTELTAGNLGDAVAMIDNPDAQLAMYAQAASSMSGFNDLFANYFSRIDYQLEATEVTEEYITVTASGTGPDMQAIIDAVVEDQDVMVPIVEDYIESLLNGSTLDYMTIATNLAGPLADEAAVAPTAPMEVVFEVTENEDGDLVLNPQSGIGFDVEIPDLSSRTDLIFPAVSQLLADGRITFEQFSNIDSLIGIGTGAIPGEVSGSEPALQVIETGEDYYNSNLLEEDGGIYLDVTTWGYYDEGTEFQYTISYFSGTMEISMADTYVAPQDNCDFVFITVQDADDEPRDEYHIVVYDGGAGMSSVLGEFVITAG